MEVQTDYETELILAVFPTLDEAQGAVERLARQGIHHDGVRHVELPPARYDVDDGTFSEEVSGVLRGVEIGAPAGAVVGLGAAALLGAVPEVLAGLAAGGAFMGAVLGALEGAVLRSRFDDNVAAVHEVRDGNPQVLLVLRTIGSDGNKRARRVLASAGAVAFLDCSALRVS